MSINNEVAGALKAMLMPARWHGLRRNEIDRVMGGLIYPKIFRYPPKWYLVKIVELLSLKVDLTSFLSDKHPSETDQEVRNFLSDLAAEIEKTFPNIARSGQRVRISGYWFGDGTGAFASHFNEGDILPYLESETIVWERKDDIAVSPEQVLLQEFSVYYTRRTIGDRVLYLHPMEFAKLSVRRIFNEEVSHFKPDVEKLLFEMSEDRSHPLTKKIEGITKQDWTEDDENWEWYRGLLSAMRIEVVNS
ncbi:hypothetical protein [Noviherbaspirillum aerium]|uniref:hypothetical protein n=1 Tax=Noviherbaspirillum aerium TaxID=2588497 RepID=UPI00124CB429|nr:hypothetical protein [Noviherbaspirillum aerium]